MNSFLNNVVSHYSKISIWNGIINVLNSQHSQSAHLNTERTHGYTLLNRTHNILFAVYWKSELEFEHNGFPHEKPKSILSKNCRTNRTTDFSNYIYFLILNILCKISCVWHKVERQMRTNHFMIS